MSASERGAAQPCGYPVLLPLLLSCQQQLMQPLHQLRGALVHLADLLFPCLHRLLGAVELHQLLFAEPLVREPVPLIRCWSVSAQPPPQQLAHMRKDSMSFGAREVRCWRLLFGNKVPISWVYINVHVVPWSGFPIVPSYPYYPHHSVTTCPTTSNHHNRASPTKPHTCVAHTASPPLYVQSRTNGTYRLKRWHAQLPTPRLAFQLSSPLSLPQSGSRNLQVYLAHKKPPPPLGPP